MKKSEVYLLDDPVPTYIHHDLHHDLDGNLDNLDVATQEDINQALLRVFEINIEDFPVKHDDSEILGEPEKYCFEDFSSHSLFSSYGSPQLPFHHDCHQTSCSSAWESEKFSQGHNNHAESDKRERLHRSATLPIIHLQKPGTQDGSVTKGMEQEPKKRELPHPFLRKQSVPDFNILLRCGAKSTTNSNKLEPGDKKFFRSKSWKLSKTLNKKSPLTTRGSAWNFDDDTDSTTSSENMTTCSDDVSYQKTPPQLFYTTPPKANMMWTAEDKKNGRRSIGHSDPASRQRSVSLDCGDGRMTKMYTSHSDQHVPQQMHGCKQMLHPSPSDPGSLLSKQNGYFSPGRPPKTPLTTPKKRASISSTDTDSSSLGRFDRKRSTRESRIYDVTSLFDAVEQQDLDVVKDILETNGIDINSVNSEFLTPLDIAVMTNNIPMAKMLLSHGARESPLFQKGEGRSDRLDLLVSEAEKRVVDLTAAVLNSGNSAMSANQQKEYERQLSHWEFRHRLLKRMKAGYDHARCPDAPTNVTLSIASSSSLVVKFGEPLNRNGAVVTKYKVQWSTSDTFTPVEGSMMLDDVRQLQVEIKHLKKGCPYYIRVAAMNMKGFSTYANSTPAYAVPSSWRDYEQTTPRSHGKLKILEELFTLVKNLRPADAPSIKDSPGSSSPVRRKKGFKNLFTSAPKFQKTLKRGVYLACYFRCEDKVLVTSEEQIPIVEVDETFAGPSLHLDLYWLMKVACTWEDIKSLRQDMERSTAEGKAHFRGKLLQAVSILQSALGTHDLGKFYYKPLREQNNSIVLATINFIKDPKVLSFSSGKWVPLSRFQRRTSQMILDPTEEQDCMNLAINEMTLYHQTSNMSLSPGLYLGYLKLHASVDLVRVLVSQTAPNVLPNVKVRDCSNVALEEWQCLKRLASGEETGIKLSSNQENFYHAINRASDKLFKMLGISEEQSSQHRVYDVEVIELSPQVAFILILPPVEDLCIVYGQSDDIADKDDLTLMPVQVFEMIHMSTYQPQLITRYSRLSSILEMDIILAQQMQREAFSKEELNVAKDRVHQLVKLQNDLDKAWKGLRWIMDIINYARSRTFRGGIPMETLYRFNSEDSLSSELEQKGKILDNNNYSSQHESSNNCNSNEISVGKDKRKIAKFYDPLEETSNGHLPSQKEPVTSQTESQSGILRVYAAYETGLAKGTSVKLHVTPKTTAMEVITLVVQNLNQTLINKGKEGPIYSDDQLPEFCLVAVIGARERILRDDYQLLQLQNPWTKGKLYVRMRNNLLAAIQQGQATAV